MKYFLLFLFLNIPNLSFAQLVSGPMLGYVEHREALIWMEFSPDVKEVTIEYWPAANKNDQRQVHNILGPSNNLYGYNIVKLPLTNLETDTKYEYRILTDGKAVNNQVYPLTTKKIWKYRTSPPDFSFLFGSCAYVNDSIYDRPGSPYGQSLQIFRSMAAQPADFNLWGGDNVYLREGDYTSGSGIYYRYHHTRKVPEMQELLAVRPNYATWDDHDYGPNDANESFELKELALQVFKDYWGNQSYGEATVPGIYSKFSWSDADFFLLDNRYYRAPKQLKDSTNGDWNYEKKFLGPQQMEWLKKSLLTSSATFKFIVSGSQVLNPLNDFESFHQYKREHAELMNFLEEYKIRGVIFLSGDRHMSEVIKIERENTYPLYDITGSPLSSRPFTNVTKYDEFENPYRISQTLTVQQNFFKLNFSGDGKGRKMVVECFDINNKKLWDIQIRAEDLK